MREEQSEWLGEERKGYIWEMKACVDILGDELHQKGWEKTGLMAQLWVLLQPGSEWNPSRGGGIGFPYSRPGKSFLGFDGHFSRQILRCREVTLKVSEFSVPCLWGTLAGWIWWVGFVCFAFVPFGLSSCISLELKERESFSGFVGVMENEFHFRERSWGFHLLYHG